MRRVISLWLPNFQTDRLRRCNVAAPPADTPFVVSAHDGHRRVIAAADVPARALGLRPGLSLAQAQARIPGLAVREAEPEADAGTLGRLTAWCLRYAPLTAPDPPDGVWIDATGAAHLAGGEAALLADLVARVEQAGFATRAAIADTPGAAWAMARYGAARYGVGDETTLRLPWREGGGGRGSGTPTPSPKGKGEKSPYFIIVPPGSTASVLASLPIRALRLSDDIVATLHRLGLTRIGQLIAAPRAPLARRFGASLLRRLDQALGAVFEPIVPLDPPELISRRLVFVEPIFTAEAFSAVIARLARSVCRRLERAGLGARQLDLLFERVDGSVQAIRVGTARPARDPAHLARLLDERLETIDPGLGVEAMRLTLPLVEPFAQGQVATLLDADTAASDLSVLLDRLTNRLGADRVYRVAPVESDVPERAVRRIPPVTPAMRRTWPAEFPRPVRLLSPPQPVRALAPLPDHPPAAFTWRGKRFRVRRADGPERIHGEWWRRDAETLAVRDYFQVEDEDGRRFWLFRRGDGVDAETGDLSWFLHGIF
jgi:protein ImuB